MTVDSKVTSVRKFYFLEYFYILLRSVELSDNNIRTIFTLFVFGKDQFQLGESKYKKNQSSDDGFSSKKLNRYSYTFREVLEEAVSYNLIKIENDEYYLTDDGVSLLAAYSSNKELYYNKIFELMENKLFGFYYLVQKCYEANKSRSGLLIFPIYSPSKLNIPKNTIKKTKDILNYIELLTNKITKDIKDHLGTNMSLKENEKNIISKLISSDLIKDDPDSIFNNKHYNVILKRIRDYWLNYFLNEVYSIKMSLSYFDIWCYRGRQLGIVNATEFYHNFDGRVVYPVALLGVDINNNDFSKIFTYPDGKSLYTHTPTFESIQEDFTRTVHESYIEIKRRVKTNFINLADLRDIVCFKLKISYNKFSEYLEQLYQLNLKNEVKLSISLEADKLPSETKAMYLKREPILIDSKPINIISIDIKKIP